MKWSLVILYGWAGCATAIAVASLTLFVADSVWVPVVALQLCLMGLLAIGYRRIDKLSDQMWLDDTSFDGIPDDITIEERNLLELVSMQPLNEIGVALLLLAVCDRDPDLLRNILTSYVNDHGNEETCDWLAYTVCPRLLDSERYWIQETLRQT